MEVEQKVWVVTHKKWQARIKTLAFEKWKVMHKKPQCNSYGFF